MSAKTKVAGVWRDAIAPYIKVNDTWKIAQSAWTKVDGAWRSWFLQGGLLDSSFTSQGADAFVRSIVVQSDGKILVGGDFSTFNGSAIENFVRLNSNGTLDTSFMANLNIGGVNTIYSIAVQPDGKILLGGSFTNFAGMLRLNSNGTLDNSFNNELGTGANNSVYSLVVQPDGKILVGGDFTQFNDVTTRRIIRLNSDGTVDTVFRTNIGSGASSLVSTVVTQPDGKILLGGLFTSFNGTTTNRIIRLNSDGTVDTVFRTNIGTGANDQVISIAIKSDGKILIGGNFFTFNGVSRSRFAVLNDTGVLDTSSAFVTNIGAGPDSTVQSILFQSDGKVVLGGSFTSFSGSSSPYIVRLNADGTRNTQFTTNLGTSVNSFLFTIASQSDNRLLFGGSFTSFNGQSYNRIVRLGGDFAG